MKAQGRATGQRHARGHHRATRLQCSAGAKPKNEARADVPCLSTIPMYHGPEELPQNGSITESGPLMKPILIILAVILAVVVFAHFIRPNEDDKKRFYGMPQSTPASKVLPDSSPNPETSAAHQTPYGAAKADDLLTDPSDTPAQRRNQLTICRGALEKPEKLQRDEKGRSILRGCYVLLHPSGSTEAAFPTKEDMKRHPKWNARMSIQKNEEWDRFSNGSKENQKKMTCEAIFKSPALQSTVRDWERDCAAYR
jgi:hypothetical protein